MRSRVAHALIVVVLLVMPARAGAVTITLGTPDPSSGSETLIDCDLFDDCLSRTVVPTALADPNALLEAPADGTIVSWRVKGAPPDYLRLRVVRRESDGSFKGLGTSGAAKVADGSGDSAVRMAIYTGQQLGLDVLGHASGTSLLGSPLPGAAWGIWDEGLLDGATSTPTSSVSSTEPLFNATVELFRPAVFQVSPATSAAIGGQIVYITGRHLTRVTSVTFGGEKAMVLGEDPEQVVAVAPPHAAGKVDVVVSTAGGPNLDSIDDDFSYVGSRPGDGPDRTKPRISTLRVSPAAFLAAPSGPSAIDSAALGADVTYRSSEAATTKFTIERRSGRRYLRLADSFERKGPAGKNRFRFSGRLGRRPLKPGQYRLVARSTDKAGNRSKPTKRAFRILGGQ